MCTIICTRYKYTSDAGGSIELLVNFNLSIEQSMLTILLGKK